MGDWNAEKHLWNVVRDRLIIRQFVGWRVGIRFECCGVMNSRQRRVVDARGEGQIARGVGGAFILLLAR